MTPSPVAARYMAWVCSRSLARIAASNPPLARIYVSCECFVWQGEVPAADRSSVQRSLPSVVCLNVISKPRQGGGLDPPGLSHHTTSCNGNFAIASNRKLHKVPLHKTLSYEKLHNCLINLTTHHFQILQWVEIISPLSVNFAHPICTTRESSAMA
jgi:hypothetical protein